MKTNVSQTNLRHWREWGRVGIRIFKIQLSLKSSDGRQAMLVYDEHRKYCSELPIGKKHGRLWPFGKRKKVYVEGFIDKFGQLVVKDILEDQEW